MTLRLGVTPTSEVSPTAGAPGVDYPEHRPHILLQLFDLSVDAMAVVGFDGYFKTVNPAWSMLLGFSSEELLSCPYIEFVHPDDRRAAVDATAGLADGSELVKFECRYLCQGGSYRWLSSSSIANLDEELIYTVARDVTLEHNQVRLERAQAAVTTVVAASGHWDGAISGVLAALCTELQWVSGEYWRVDDKVLHVARTWAGAAGGGLSTGDSVPSAAMRNNVPIVLDGSAELARPGPSRTRVRHRIRCRRLPISDTRGGSSSAQLFDTDALRSRGGTSGTPRARGRAPRRVCRPARPRSSWTRCVSLLDQQPLSTAPRHDSLTALANRVSLTTAFAPRSTPPAGLGPRSRS